MSELQLANNKLKQLDMVQVEEMKVKVRKIPQHITSWEKNRNVAKREAYTLFATFNI